MEYFVLLAPLPGQVKANGDDCRTQWGLIALVLLGLFIDHGGGEATAYGTNHGMPGHQFPRFQKNFWYEYSTPPSTSFPEYIDYHLSPESVTTMPPNRPHLLNPVALDNITAQLGAPARLSCLIKNLQDKTVSWLKQNDDVPILLTFGQSVYIHDVRITVERNRYREGKQEWVLNILNAQKSDQGLYECQISTEPPQIHRINLYVEAPVLTVMDGFGRELVDQYYKVGSSLEVMCTVDRLPARPLPQIIEWRHGNRKLAQENATLGQSIRTDLQDEGAISHLSITQANVGHSGIYTCSVSDTISQSLRLHIIDESKPVPIINNSCRSHSRMPNQWHHYALLLALITLVRLLGFLSWSSPSLSMEPLAPFSASSPSQSASTLVLSSTSFRLDYQSWLRKH